MRITEGVLCDLVRELNIALKMPEKAFDETSGRWTKGAYDLRQIEGGYQVVRLKTVTTGAVESMSPAPLCQPREVAAWLQGAIYCIEHYHSD